MLVLARCTRRMLWRTRLRWITRMLQASGPADPFAAFHFGTPLARHLTIFTGGI